MTSFRTHFLLHEDCAQSTYSPGLVGNEEVLLRTGFNPEAIDEHGNVRKTAIPSEHLKKSGFSVDRKKYASAAIIRERVAAQKANPNVQGRAEEFIYELLTQVVRHEMLDANSERINIVLDTAREDNRAHASIYTFYRSPSEIKQLKDMLEPFLRRYVPLEKYLQEHLEVSNAAQ